MSQYSYSHLAEGKGTAYDEEFGRSQFLSYLWKHERGLLLALAGQEKQRLASIGAEFRYLDFACGTGRVLAAIEHLADRAVGVDISPAMLSEARGKVARSELVLGDVLASPGLLQGKFDLITAFRFFPNAEPELRERVAAFLASRADAHALVVVNNHQNSASSLRVLARLTGKQWPWRFVSNREIIEVMKRAGFGLCDQRGFGLLPGTARRAFFPLWLHSAVDYAGGKLRLDGFTQDTVMWFRRI